MGLCCSRSIYQVYQLPDESTPGFGPDPRRYTDWDSVEVALAKHDAILLKGKWLMEWSEKHEPLPRRQSLPEGSTWAPQELMPLLRAGSVEPVAISYCWLTPEHPDPKGEQASLIALAVKVRLQAERDEAVDDLAIFFDWCSLYQKERTPAQGESFDRALKDVNLWYAHQLVSVWMLTEIPEGWTGVKCYTERGWPSFEYGVSTMITPSWRVIDISLLRSPPESWTHDSRNTIQWQSDVSGYHDGSGGKCKARRPAPLMPQQFADLLATKTFTNNADHSFVAKKYKTTFDEVISCAQSLDFAGLGWGDMEFVQLSECLCLCSQCRSLNLSSNKDGGADGINAIMKALGASSTISAFSLKWGDLGSEAGIVIAEALESNSTLTSVDLSSNKFGNEAGIALAKALERNLPLTSRR
mmetsp:Transcript_33760/g.73471  ORF Transcript_33760/g.73471 Transcript_33760/m.73471 type:complete len:413 (+) Transcript_33760:116-1354(+)